METSDTKEVSQKHALGIFFYPPICEIKKPASFLTKFIVNPPNLVFLY